MSAAQCICCFVEWTWRSLFSRLKSVAFISQADLVANIAELVDKGTITGIADVRDESDRSGMRIVVEARRGSATEVR